ncbi:MAG: hypothetical protein O3B73_10310, partial [bacterium]|nr:hypothetical protein [bacterium]
KRLESLMDGIYKPYRLLRKEMEAWLEQSRRMDPPGRHGGGEDEANYALAWFPHYLVTGSRGVKSHFEYLREMLAGWVARDCLHGYEPEAEAHHGTEPFLLFLPRYLGLFADDKEAAALLDDAAEHIGNWVADIPAWYDWDRDRFNGYYIGTRTVGGDDAYDVELAEHFRFIHIALAAHRVTGLERYLAWALRYGRRRARMIVDLPEGPLPVVWGPAGEPIWHGTAKAEQQKAAQGNHHVAGDPLIGVEVLLASGAIYALGDLYEASGDEVFQRAAKRIAEPLVGELLDPYADPGAAAVSYYRQTFADDSLDAAILARMDQMPEPQAGEFAMVFPQARKREWPGIGKRNDMTYWGIWGADGSVNPTTEPSTAALTLAYQLTGKPEYAERALTQAVTKLTMARRALRGGREHADMGSAICSAAAGHGRNWGMGAVTGCYGPLLLGTREVKGSVTMQLEVKHEGGFGLPEGVVSLVRSAKSACFYNGGESLETLFWRWNGGSWKELKLNTGEGREVS